jgi:hypothetical protein
MKATRPAAPTAIHARMVSRIFTCLPSSLVAGSLSNLVFMIVKRWRTECQLALGGSEGLLKLARP